MSLPHSRDRHRLRLSRGNSTREQRLSYGKAEKGEQVQHSASNVDDAIYEVNQKTDRQRLFDQNLSLSIPHASRITCDFRNRMVPMIHISRPNVMQRFGQMLIERQGQPVFIADVCEEIGVSDRTLRTYCQEHLGTSPHRYLFLRRMNLAREALTAANPTTKTVTQIALDYGFGELGRFSVKYKREFGESPSATLGRY